MFRSYSDHLQALKYIMQDQTGQSFFVNSAKAILKPAIILRRYSNTPFAIFCKTAMAIQVMI